MKGEKLISVFIKDIINIDDFIQTYGENGKQYINDIIIENSSILENLKKNDAIIHISKLLGDNIDFAKSMFNFYIENTLKDTMICNLKEEILEKNEEIEIYKGYQEKENKALVNAINTLYNKRIGLKSEIPRLRTIRK